MQSLPCTDEPGKNDQQEHVGTSAGQRGGAKEIVKNNNITEKQEVRPNPNTATTTEGTRPTKIQKTLAGFVKVVTSDKQVRELDGPIAIISKIPPSSQCIGCGKTFQSPEGMIGHGRYCRSYEYVVMDKFRQQLTGKPSTKT